MRYNIEYMQKTFENYNKSKQTRRVGNRDEIILVNRSNGFSSSSMITVRPTGRWEGKRFIADGTGKYSFHVCGLDKENPAVVVCPVNRTYTVTQPWMYTDLPINQVLPSPFRFYYETPKYAPDQYILCGGQQDYPTRRWCKEVPFVLTEDGVILSGGDVPIIDDVTPEKSALLKKYRKRIKEWFAEFELLRGGDMSHAVYGYQAVTNWCMDNNLIRQSNHNNITGPLQGLMRQLSSDTPDEHVAYMCYLKVLFHVYGNKIIPKTLDRLMKEAVYQKARI